MFSKIVGLFAIIDVVYSTIANCNGYNYDQFSLAIPPDHCMGS